MADGLPQWRTGGKGGYSLYTTPVPEGKERRPSSFSDWDGYGGFGGFIDTQEPRTPEYEDAINTVADALTKQDFEDPRYHQIVEDMAAEHGRPTDNAWWDLMDDPEAHAKAWLPQHSTYPGQIPYNWAYANDSPFHDGYNELERNMPGWKPSDGPKLPIDSPEDARKYLGAHAAHEMERQAWINAIDDPPPRQDYIDRDWDQPHNPLYFDPDDPGTGDMPSGLSDERFLRDLEMRRRFEDRAPHLGHRLAYEHDMNVGGQLNKLKAREQDARNAGDHEMGDYIKGLQEVFQRDVDAGRPEGHKAYLPMVREEFGDERARPIVGSVDREFLVAMREASYVELVALQGPPADPPPPDVDWDPVMDSVKNTGGYTLDGPDSGYMISIPGSEEKRPTDTVTPATEGDYHKRHWDQLLDDPDLSQGGWDDKDTFYTDLSRNDSDLYRTVGDAVSTDQLGIYDLNRGQTLDTYDNPETDRDDYNPLMVSPGPVMAFGSLHVGGPLLPGTDDVAGYEQDQFPTPPRRLAPQRKKPPTPEQRKKDRAKLRQKQRSQKPVTQALDPNALDARIDVDALVKNALSRYNAATPEQRQGGRTWYATARARAEELARRTGGDFSKAAAIIAAMSPQMEWEGNLNAAAHFINTYDPTRKHEWRKPNVSQAGLDAWNQASGGRAPQSPEDFAQLAQLSGIDDQDWAKEMAMPGAWDRAVAAPSSKAYTGTGLPTLGDNVLRAMAVYDSEDPRELLDYSRGGPKIHSFWRNFLGDESFATIDKHMLRALDRSADQDPLLSYGKNSDEASPEDLRVRDLEKMLGYKQTLTGDETTQVPTGYNTYSEAIRRATAEANKGLGPGEQPLTTAQMQAIIWLQHKDSMDAFKKRKSEEAWAAKNPGKTYAPKPSTYVPGVPTNGPAPSYYETDEWADENPYKGGTPRPHVPEFKGPAMKPDNIPDPALGPAEMGIMPAAPWADPSWSQEPEMARAASILFGF